MAGKSLEELVIALRLDLKGYEANLAKADRKTRTSFKQMAASSDRFNNSLSKMRGLAVKVTGVLAGAGVTGALIRATKSWVTNTAAIADNALKLGISTDFYQESTFAARSLGIAQNTLSMAYQRVIRRSAEASKGTGEAKDAIDELGVQLLTTEGRLRSSEMILGDMMRALAGVEDEGQKLRLGFKLFDSEGAILVTLANRFEELRARARDMGLVLDESVIKEAAAAREEFEIMSSLLSVTLAPAFLEVAKAMVAVSLETRRLIDLFKELDDRSTASLTTELDSLKTQRAALAKQFEAFGTGVDVQTALAAPATDPRGLMSFLLLNRNPSTPEELEENRGIRAGLSTRKFLSGESPGQRLIIDNVLDQMLALDPRIAELTAALESNTSETEKATAAAIDKTSGLSVQQLTKNQKAFEAVTRRTSTKEATAERKRLEDISTVIAASDSGLIDREREAVELEAIERLYDQTISKLSDAGQKFKDSEAATKLFPKLRLEAEYNENLRLLDVAIESGKVAGIGAIEGQKDRFVAEYEAGLQKIEESTQAFKDRQAFIDLVPELKLAADMDEELMLVDRLIEEGAISGAGNIEAAIEFVKGKYETSLTGMKKKSASAFDSIGKHMGDAGVNAFAIWLTTGKLTFKRLLEEVKLMFARAAIRSLANTAFGGTQLGQAFGFVSSGLGLIGGSGGGGGGGGGVGVSLTAGAMGGSARANELQLVGERGIEIARSAARNTIVGASGPELIQSSFPTTIIPNHVLQAMAQDQAARAGQVDTDAASATDAIMSPFQMPAAQLTSEAIVSNRALVAEPRDQAVRAAQMNLGSLAGVAGASSSVGGTDAPRVSIVVNNHSQAEATVTETNRGGVREFEIVIEEIAARSILSGKGNRAISDAFNLRRPGVNAGTL